jgi:hypothetical protein
MHEHANGRFLRLALAAASALVLLLQGSAPGFAQADTPDATQPVVDTGQPPVDMPTDTLPPASDPIGPGVSGQVVLGPACPVQRAGDPSCDDRPYPTTVVVLAPDGHEIQRVDTDAKGMFFAVLSPGDYLVQALLRAPSPGPVPVPVLIRPPAPVPVTVNSSDVTALTIALDSGIR